MSCCERYNKFWPRESAHTELFKVLCHTLPNKKSSLPDSYKRELRQQFTLHMI